MYENDQAVQLDVIIARHQDRLTRHPESYSQLLKVCVQQGVTIHLYTGGVLDLATSHGGFMGMISTAVAWQESAIRSERVKAAIQRNVGAGRRTGGGTRPFGYRVIKHDTGGEGRLRYKIIREEIEHYGSPRGGGLGVHLISDHLDLFRVAIAPAQHGVVVHVVLDGDLRLAEVTVRDVAQERALLATDQLAGARSLALVFCVAARGHLLLHYMFITVICRSLPGILATS